MTSDEQHSAPPVSDELHLPGPSGVPLVNAAGVALALLGLMISPLVVAVGLLIVVMTTVRWISDTKRDIADLPLEHH